MLQAQPSVGVCFDCGIFSNICGFTQLATEPRFPSVGMSHYIFSYSHHSEHYLTSLMCLNDVFTLFRTKEKTCTTDFVWDTPTYRTHYLVWLSALIILCWQIFSILAPCTSGHRWSRRHIRFHYGSDIYYTFFMFCLLHGNSPRDKWCQTDDQLLHYQHPGMITIISCYTVYVDDL